MISYVVLKNDNRFENDKCALYRLYTIIVHETCNQLIRLEYSQV